MGTLAEDACALMTATVDAAGENVADARKRVADALESAKEIAGAALCRLANSSTIGLRPR